MILWQKVVTFGEIMLRLTPPDYKRIVQTDTFDIIYGGGEANVAVSPPLARRQPLYQSFLIILWAVQP